MRKGHEEMECQLPYHMCMGVQERSRVGGSLEEKKLPQVDVSPTSRGGGIKAAPLSLVIPMRQRHLLHLA